MTVPTDDVRVEIENFATPEEVEAIQATLDEYGIPATATPTLEPDPRGGLFDPALIIEITVAFGLYRFADAFISEVGKSAGKSAVEGLAGFVGRFRSRRPRSGGYDVVFRNGQTDLRVSLRDDHPSEAITALADLDLDALGPGMVVFDHRTGKWAWIPD